MGEVRTISSETVWKRFETKEPLYIIDVREQHEVAGGMIPGAVHIPMNDIPDRLDVFKEGVEYIIVCAAGVRSENVAAYLSANGYDAVSMEGGMYSWAGDTE